MAYLATDQNQQVQGQQQQGSGAAPNGGQLSSGSGITPLTGGGTGAGPITNSPTPVQSPQGGGGTGWTNIQSYLTANQGNTNASDTLANNVGTSFTQDQNNIGQQAQDTQSKASQAGQANYIAPDQASQMLSQASSEYAPTNQPQDYQNIVGQFQNTLYGQYSGPQKGSFVPTLSSNTTQYGQALNNDDQLNSLMGQFYNKQSGQNLSTGQLDLQNLLQNNDPNFQAQRQSLQNQYANLQPYLTQQMNDTNAAIQNAQTQYGANQKTLNDYLSGQQGQSQDALNQAVNSWNNIYQNPNGPASQFANSQLQAIMNMTNTPSQMGTISDLLRNTGPNHTTFDVNNYINRGTQATTSNVPGAQDSRNQFNTIADILHQAPIVYDSNAPQAVTANYGGLYNDIEGALNAVIGLDQKAGYGGTAAAIQNSLENPFNSSYNSWVNNPSHISPNFFIKQRAL